VRSLCTARSRHSLVGRVTVIMLSSGGEVGGSLSGWQSMLSVGGAGDLVERIPMRRRLRWPSDVARELGGFWRIILAVRRG